MPQPWVDPDLVDALEFLPRFTLTPESLAAVRSAPRPPFEPVDGVEFVEQHIPGPPGAPEVRILIGRPTGRTETALPGFVWMHGGGYVLGSPDSDRPLLAEIVRQVGAVVVAPDYRLAPETPFPGPHEDCYAALSWLHANADDLGVEPDRIAIGGGSAGAGLAASLALMARDRGEVPVRFQLLIYPMLDDRSVVEERDPGTGDYVWNRDANRFGWTSLLGYEPGGEDVPPYAAPARAHDLAGLPPAFVSVGQLDLFREEDMAYASRLMAAGVPTTLHVYAGGFHGFNLIRTAPFSQRHDAEVLRQLSRALG